MALAIPEETSGGWANISAFPTDAPETAAEYDTIKRVRTAVHAVSGAEAIVGGPSAENLDTEVTTSRDEKLVIPLVLAVVLIVLGLLLRAIVAPLVLMATVIVSFAAAFGGSVFVFDTILGFKGIDYSVPLLAFLFLVALGVDYNIFLTSRAREETVRLGTRKGMLKALSATGGVITSAGVVLAATFAVLATLPLVMLIEVGFLVAFGVLLDALLVRSVLVPALTLLIGGRIWWPSGCPVQRRSCRTVNGRSPPTRSPRCNGERGGTDEIRDGDPGPSRIFSCARRPPPLALRRAAGAGVGTPRCPARWWAARDHARGAPSLVLRRAPGAGQRTAVSYPAVSRATGAGGAAAGRSTRSSAPPRAERATVARPPWASTTRCTIDSPRPDPGNARRCRHGRTGRTPAVRRRRRCRARRRRPRAPPTRPRRGAGPGPAGPRGTTCRRCR